MPKGSRILHNRCNSTYRVGKPLTHLVNIKKKKKEFCRGRGTKGYYRLWQTLTIIQLLLYSHQHAVLTFIQTHCFLKTIQLCSFSSLYNISGQSEHHQFELKRIDIFTYFYTCRLYDSMIIKFQFLLNQASSYIYDNLPRTLQSAQGKTVSGYQKSFAVYKSWPIIKLLPVLWGFPDLSSGSTWKKRIHQIICTLDSKFICYVDLKKK